MHYDDFKRKISFWPKRIHPTVEQYHLLSACLAEEKSAFEISWKTWVRLQDFDNLDNESLKLIPSLFKQVEHFQVEDANLPRYRGIYKKNWITNLKMQKDIYSFLEALVQKQIAYRLIGNFPILLTTYQDLSTVRLSGIEMIVLRKDILEYLDLLEYFDFKFKAKKTIRKAVLRRLELGGTCSFEDCNGWVLNVTYSGFPFRAKNEVYKVFDTRDSKIQLGNLLIDSVNIEFDLVRLLTNGFAGSTISQLFWVVAVQKLLNHHKGNIDWDKFIDIAQMKDVTYLVHLSLRYLSTYSTIQIPDEVSKRLGATPSKFNRVIYYHVKYRSKITGILKRFFKG